MNATPGAERLELDLLRYLDHVTDETESEQLRTRLLQDPDARHVFAELLLRQQMLVEASQSAKATRQLEEVPPAATAPQASQMPQRRRFVRRSSRGQVWSWMSAAALIGLAVTAYLILSEDPCAARVTECQPGSEETDAGLQPGERVKPGRSIALPPGARLTLRYPDGSELQCSDGARLVLASQRNAKEVRLECGWIRAVVAPQPKGKPFMLRTARTQTEVLGTRLQLVAGLAQDLLILDEGSVRFVRSADGAETRVGAGELALAGKTAESLKTVAVGRQDVARLTTQILSGAPVLAASLDPATVFIEDMTLSNVVKPIGVPASTDWLEKPRFSTRIPDGWNAVTMWGRVAVGRPESPAVNVRVQIADLRVWYLSRKDGTWRPVIQDVGAACRYESLGTEKSAMDLRHEAGGSIAVRLPTPAEHIVLWPTVKGPGRATISPEDVAGVAACYMARLIVNDPARPDDREQARIVASCGGSFFPDLATPFKEDYSNSAEWAFGRFKLLTVEWQAVTACTVGVDVLRANPPPLPVR